MLLHSLPWYNVIPRTVQMQSWALDTLILWIIDDLTAELGGAGDAAEPQDGVADKQEERADELRNDRGSREPRGRADGHGPRPGAEVGPEPGAAGRGVEDGQDVRQRPAWAQAAVRVQRRGVVHAARVGHGVDEDAGVGAGERAQDRLHLLRPLVRRLVEEPQHRAQDQDDLRARVQEQVPQDVFV